MILYNPTVSGSLQVTGSLTTTGTLTAQTLVVQTITSSVDFVTGSSVNGSLSSNTHQFTGSVLMSGSLGIGTSSPQAKLDFGPTNIAQTILLFSTGNYKGGFGTADGELRNFIWDSAANGFTFGSLSSANGTTFNEKMRITTAGNVGIGLSSPGYQLQVTGSISVISSGSADIRVQGGNYSGDYNTTLRSISGARGILQLGNNADNYIIGGNSNAGGYLIFRVNASTESITSGIEAMRITSGGNVIIQNNKIYGTGEYLGAIWNSNGGNTTWTIGDTPANQTSWNLRVNTSAAKSGGGSWGDSSDGRLKKDIQPIQNALEEINKLNPVTFEWINPEEHNNQYNIGGFIAQEIKEIFPQFINEINAEGKDKDIVGENEVVYGLTLPFKFDAYLVKAIQELKAEIDTLKQQQ